MAGCDATPRVPRFARRFFDRDAPIAVIGGGSPGGKARGLLAMRDLLAGRQPGPATASVTIDVPAMVVIQHDVFDEFVRQNGLAPLLDGPGDGGDRRVALAFQAAHLPASIVGDLRALAEHVRVPLAVRSSSLLEDAVQHPSAGVYTTKMIPNDRHEADSRFLALTEAIKLVYASTCFAAARRSREAAGPDAPREGMAVIIQEVVGRRHRARFYPDVSAVARSYAFYRSGSTRPEDGVAALALGLGKTIVDGGVVWSYSPAHPRATPPFGSAAEQVARTQSEFWAVSMTGHARYDPVNEVEYLSRAGLPEALADGTLDLVASSYDRASDRLRAGAREGAAHALNFAPLLVLETYPVNAVIRELLALGQAAVGAPVEIECAFTFAPGAESPCRCGFLQVRPMAVCAERVVIDAAEMQAAARLVASESVMGNGTVGDIQDVVFVRRDSFAPARSRAIAAEIADINRDLVLASRPYLLLGFGRWGSADPWLGIPVDWAGIAGARAIVETTPPGAHVDPSQGSHFFHNLSSAGVLYFTVRPGVDPAIDWAWLESLPPAFETTYVRHVRTPTPLRVRVDGRQGRGVILRGPAAAGC